MSKVEYDVVIIGSGATGGVAAKRFAELGLSVVILEAGPSVRKANGYPSMMNNGMRQLWRRTSGRQNIQSMHATYWTTNPNFFVDDIANPYSTQEDKPFRWIRARIEGGRTLTWDGVTPRMSNYEFKAASQDGVGPDWPISYDDLAPYYSELEKYFGISGAKDNLPQVPDGVYKTSGQMTKAEHIFKDRVEQAFDTRKVIISRGLRHGRQPKSHETHSKLSNLSTTLKDALNTKNTTLVYEAIVSRILLHKDGQKARGVEYIDGQTGQFCCVEAKKVFLCASTIESVRILLNSECSQHPGGIGHSSGLLGRHLMDHIASNIYFQLPDVIEDTGAELLGGEAIMIPRFQNLETQDSSHLRGYSMWGGINRIQLPRLLRKLPGEVFGFLCVRGEVLPYYDNYISIDPQLKDIWGIPCPRIKCEWKENELALITAARKAAIETIEAAGGEVAPIKHWVSTPMVDSIIEGMEREWRTSTPGLFVHELGGARMGTSPDNSVVNPHCAVWDVPNIFVTDGACWPTSGWQNPTLTEMAITARVVDHVVAQR